MKGTVCSTGIWTNGNYFNNSLVNYLAMSCKKYCYGNQKRAKHSHASTNDLLFIGKVSNTYLDVGIECIDLQ